MTNQLPYPTELDRPPAMWVRPAGQRTVVKMPYVPAAPAANITWLKELGLRPSKGPNGTWLINRARTDEVRAAMLTRWRQIVVVVDVATQIKCGARCQTGNPDNALECECSCGGINHGGGAGWATFGGFDISTDYTRKVWRLPS